MTQLTSKPILLSGIKPTGSAHIGNYFGAMKQWVELVNTGNYEAYIMIADYHALNFIQDGTEMRRLTYELALDYLGIGLDPEKCTLFKQSDIGAHTELTWIFDTLVTMPYLMRAHAFKDAEAKDKEISVGTFNYPVLMAADILLYDADCVPVGQDQKQHVEYARDIALKFNHTYSASEKTGFKLPEPLITESVATVPGTDGKKMSKSYNNTIPLFATDEEIAAAVMGIVTDSSGERPANVYAIHRLFKSEAELAPVYEVNKGKYQALKQALIADIQAFIAPMRERRNQYASNPDAVRDILNAGAKVARLRAENKLNSVKKIIGVTY